MGDAPGERSDDAVQPGSILGRRDVALIPWAVTAAVATALAISEALRAPGSDALVATIATSLLLAAVSLAVVAVTDRPAFIPLRTSLVVYSIASTGLILSMSVLAITTDGLQTVIFSALVLEALYLGLVLRPAWSGAFTGAMLVAAGIVQALEPKAPPFDVATVTGLITAGWALGLLCRAAHRRAERVAMRLTRCDLLTASLNRRGLIEELDAMTVDASRAGHGVALMILDLDGFKQVNRIRGNAGGDELLAWVGGVLGSRLPPGASAGRLGSDEFAVAIAGVPRDAVLALAAQLQSAIAERSAVSIGIATSDDGLVSTIDLLRVADAAMRVCKADPDESTHALIAGGFRRGNRYDAGPRPPKPVAIRYDSLRAMGGRPERPGTGVIFGWLVRGGFVVVGLAGGVVVASTFISGGESFWEDVIRVLGVPWVLTCLGMGIAFSGPAIASERGTLAAFTISNLLIGGGVGTAALATGAGIAAPIAAGFGLKVAFDSAIGDAFQARLTFLIITGWWVATAVLGPASVLWAAPLQFTLLGAAYALGSISRRAMSDTTQQWLRLARTDVLTGLANRSGFADDSDAALRLATETGGRVAVLALDLDGFKSVNEAAGPAAGDAVLRRVADVLRAVLPDAAAAGRLGADEFVATVPIGKLDDADHLGLSVRRAVGGILPASTGVAVFPDDGGDVESLVRAADLRCRAAKAAQRRV